MTADKDASFRRAQRAAETLAGEALKMLRQRYGPNYLPQGKPSRVTKAVRPLGR